MTRIVQSKIGLCILGLFIANQSDASCRYSWPEYLREDGSSLAHMPAQIRAATMSKRIPGPTSSQRTIKSGALFQTPRWKLDPWYGSGYYKGRDTNGNVLFRFSEDRDFWFHLESNTEGHPLGLNFQIESIISATEASVESEGSHAIDKGRVDLSIVVMVSVDGEVLRRKNNDAEETAFLQLPGSDSPLAGRIASIRRSSGDLRWSWRLKGSSALALSKALLGKASGAEVVIPNVHTMNQINLTGLFVREDVPLNLLEDLFITRRTAKHIAEEIRSGKCKPGHR